MSLVAVAIGMLLYVWNPGGVVRGHWLDVLTAYSVLVLAYHPRAQAPSFNRGGDYSYGLYVYAFPVQQLIVHLVPGLTTIELLIPAFAATLALAAISWHFLERPILGLKSRFH